MKQILPFCGVPPVAAAHHCGRHIVRLGALVLLLLGTGRQQAAAQAGNPAAQPNAAGANAAAGADASGARTPNAGSPAAGATTPADSSR